MTEDEKNRVKEYQRSHQVTKKSNIFLCMCCIKKRGKASKSDDVDQNQIVIFDKFNHCDKCAKYFIGYAGDDVIRPLCIALPQISGHIKYFYNGGKNISFRIEDDSMLIKYYEIWNRIKRTLGIVFIASLFMLRNT